MNNKKAPFDFATYCKIMQTGDDYEDFKAFEKKADEIREQIGSQIVDDLLSSNYTMRILLHSANAGTLKSSRIIYVASKSAAYAKASKENKPYIFLDTIVPFWYASELGADYLSCRDMIFRTLNVPLCSFLKLETFEGFRKAAPKLKKSAIKRISAVLKQRGANFTLQDISTAISK